MQLKVIDNDESNFVLFTHFDSLAMVGSTSMSSRIANDDTVLFNRIPVFARMLRNE